MRSIKYVQPNMTNLRGKKGKAILAEIRGMKARWMTFVVRQMHV